MPPSGLAESDDDRHRLVFCLTAQGVRLHSGRDAIDAVAPRLDQVADAVRRWGI